jgi:hypothetical protein
MSKLSILSELWEFLKVRKKWWLLPIILFLVLLGGLIILTQGSALAPFIYAIFCSPTNPDIPRDRLSPKGRLRAAN